MTRYLRVRLDAATADRATGRSPSEPVPLLDRVFPPAQCVHDADRYFGDLARRRQWLADQAAS